MIYYFVCCLLMILCYFLKTRIDFWLDCLLVLAESLIQGKVRRMIIGSVWWRVGGGFRVQRMLLLIKSFILVKFRLLKFWTEFNSFGVMTLTERWWRVKGRTCRLVFRIFLLGFLLFLFHFFTGYFEDPLLDQINPEVVRTEVIFVATAQITFAFFRGWGWRWWKRFSFDRRR